MTESAREAFRRCWVWALAIASVVGFWAIPLSPFVSLLALSSSSASTGWVRRWSVAGSLLCCGYTTFLALWVGCFAIGVYFGRVH